MYHYASIHKYWADNRVLLGFKLAVLTAPEYLYCSVPIHRRCVTKREIVSPPQSFNPVSTTVHLHTDSLNFRLSTSQPMIQDLEPFCFTRSCHSCFDIHGSNNTLIPSGFNALAASFMCIHGQGRDASVSESAVEGRKKWFLMSLIEFGKKSMDIVSNPSSACGLNVGVLATSSSEDVPSSDEEGEEDVEGYKEE